MLANSFGGFLPPRGQPLHPRKGPGEAEARGDASAGRPETPRSRRAPGPKPPREGALCSVPGHLTATAGHCRARPAGKMRTPRVNTAACPPRVTAKEDFHVTHQMPSKARVGGQVPRLGDVWPRNSLAALGTCHHQAPPPVKLRVPQAFLGSKGSCCVWGSPSWAQPPGRLFPPPHHPPPP